MTLELNLTWSATINYSWKHYILKFKLSLRHRKIFHFKLPSASQTASKFIFLLQESTLLTRRKPSHTKMIQKFWQWLIWSLPIRYGGAKGCCNWRTCNVCSGFSTNISVFVSLIKKLYVCIDATHWRNSCGLLHKSIYS